MRSSSPPLRFCYFAHAYRSVRPSRGQAREMLQAGIELVGAPGPEGTIEALELLCEVLDAVGLDGYRIGLGDASLYPALLDAVGVPDAARGPLLHELVTRDFVGLEREIEALRLGVGGVGGAAADAAAARRRLGARRRRAGGRGGRAAADAARGADPARGASG